MEISAGRFDMRLAASEDEVQSAQRLRYRVFVEEMNAAATPEQRAARREMDRFDAVCDHLILIDRDHEPEDPLDRVVGVYRLMRGSVASGGPGFYTATEFDLSRIEAYDGETLELGRSCIAAEYRGGAAMQLLWMGLAQYINAHDLKLLFGCASFHGNDLASLAMPLAFLYHNHLAPEPLRARVLSEHFHRIDLLPKDALDRLQAMRALPTLIKGYLRLGGFVGDGAYIDRDFNTVDVCLIMETSRISSRYKTFYGGDAKGSLERLLG